MSDFLYGALVGGITTLVAAIRVLQNRLSPGAVRDDGELHAMRKQLSDATAKLDFSQKQEVELAARLEASAKRVAGLENQLKVTAAERDRQASAYRELETARSTAEEQLESTSALLASRSLELQAAQAFLSTGDTLSGAQAIQEVQDLNSEIQQTSAILSERFQFARRAAGRHQAGKASEGIVQTLGKAMIKLLTEREHTEDPTIVQIALQGALSYFAIATATKWSLDFQNADEGRIWTLYQAIRKSEVQAVAGRWRALTSQHLRLRKDGTMAVFDRHLAALVGLLSSVIIVSGCTDGGKTVETVLSEELGERLRTLLTRILHIGVRLREEVTSTDLLLSHMRPGQPFSEEQAEDSYSASGSSSKGAVIVCTTDLGLYQVTKAGSALHNLNDQANTEVVLLKPKVLLSNAVDTL